MVASEPAGLETLLRLLLSGQLAPVQQGGAGAGTTGRDPSGVIGMPSCVSLVGRQVIV